MDRGGDNQARGIISGRNVKLVGESARVTVPRGGHGAACPAQPQVEVVREGDVIRAIDVTCTCGQKIRIRCEY
jgi:hypothetical protein